jgi:hypothetical protein
MSSYITTYRKFILLVLTIIVATIPVLASRSTSSGLPDFGKATVTKTGDVFTLSNSAIAASWKISGRTLIPLLMRDNLDRRPIPTSDNLFVLTIADGGLISSSSMKIVRGPEIVVLRGRSESSRLSDRIEGKEIAAELEDTGGQLHVTWRAVLRDDSNYIRQEVTLHANGSDLRVAEVRLIDLTAAGARVSGMVKGSPVVAGNHFWGFEHPISESRVVGNRVICRISRELPLRAGQDVTYSSVAGVTPPGQLRRAFLYYIERERAHPYRTFLHYNSWYDIGYFSKFDQAAALNVIDAFGKELVQKRGVKMDSFLFDDGWDDNTTLWHFNAGFPNGFTPVREEAAKYGTSPGVWLSPWGGYGKPREERLKYGKEQGFETNAGGFALSGPKYFARFREITIDFIQKYGVNQFKIDGTGNVDSAIKGSQFDSDFHAAISLINEWRAIKPDIYVNLTTGTYPSPFWLHFADSIWRGGDDHSFAGVGSDRQRWITYRDADTFQGVVQNGPLYPLNSLMLHGLIYARHARHLDSDPNGDFKDEIHDYFGTGTQLQEMYITPSLLTDNDWDVLAEAAKWSRANADVLVDTHWIGGDPAMLEVYGWASWSPRMGIIVLRNPSDKEQIFRLDVQKAFELPPGAARNYTAASPWKEDAGKKSVELAAGQPYELRLAPFQVLTLDATPVR